MAFVSGFLMVLLLFTAVFLIVLVLIQRGKGGGLAGAFGGMGGQSAFGTKAGDLFTRITMGVAAFWIILCMVALKVIAGGHHSAIDSTMGGAATESNPAATAPARPGGESKGASSTPASGSSAPASDSKAPAPESSAPVSGSSAPASESEGGKPNP